jgi:hypothetical protein
MGKIGKAFGKKLTSLIRLGYCGARVVLSITMNQKYRPQSRLNYLIGVTESEVAKNNEKRVVTALTSEYPFPNRPAWIGEVRLSTKEEDHRGIDVVIETTDVGNILIQVKSSHRGREEFLMRQVAGKVSVKIIPVIINPRYDPHTICRIIMPLITHARNERLRRKKTA